MDNANLFNKDKINSSEVVVAELIELLDSDTSLDTNIVEVIKKMF